MAGGLTMGSATLTVHDLSVMTEAEWSFRDSKPAWRHRVHGSIATFDPFPAYAHDRIVVEQAAAHVVKRCPPVWDVELYIADREEVGHSNGFSNVHEGGRYVDGEWVKGEPTGLIVLSGKRVPPHPALTSYLVAHEYGHNVEWMLERRLHGSKGLHAGNVVRDYARMRGLDEDVHHGSGGRWHDSATEILACDFRIVVCDVEVPYWPHPGIPHPRDLSLPGGDLWSWWADALEQLKTPGEVGNPVD